MRETYEDDYMVMSTSSAWTQMIQFIELSHLTCQGAVSSNGWKQLQNYPDNFKFDLVIHDFNAGFCLLAFLEKFNNPPVISITAFNEMSTLARLMGNVLTPSISTLYAFKTLQKGFINRFVNYGMQVVDAAIREYYMNPKISKIVRDSTPFNLPPAAELRKRTQLVMFNYSPVVDAGVQLSPNVIPVGGLQIHPVKPLPRDLEDIMNSRPKGVVLFALGTNIHIESIGRERLIYILEAFRKIPEYTVLCKFELENMPVPLPKNVFLRKWLPQNDILGHNNTKLFITHSGMLSTQEASWHGVPMLGMPIFADQYTNIERSVERGVAEQLLWPDVTTEALHSKIVKILEDPSYATNMKIVSQLFRDQPELPLDRAIWWIEWVMRNPNTGHMRGISHELNFIELQSIDVIAVFVLFIAVILWIGLKVQLFVFRLGIRYCFNNKK